MDKLIYLCCNIIEIINIELKKLRILIVCTSSNDILLKYPGKMFGMSSYLFQVFIYTASNYL